MIWASYTGSVLVGYQKCVSSCFSLVAIEVAFYLLPYVLQTFFSLLAML